MFDALDIMAYIFSARQTCVLKNILIAYVRQRLKNIPINQIEDRIKASL